MYNHRHVPFHYDDMATTQGFHKDDRVPFYVVPEHNTVYYGQPNTAHGEVNRYFRELDHYFMPGNINYFKGSEVFPGEWSPKEGLSPNYYAATKTSPELQQEIHNELYSLYGVPPERTGAYFFESFVFESADYGDKLHKWIYGNGEVHFGPQVNDMDDPPYHSNLVFSHFGTPPDDIACGYYWPIDNSVHMYSRADKAPARETLNAIVPQEALAQGLTDQPHEANIEGHEPGEQWGRWLRHPQTGEIVTDHSGLTHWGIVSQLGLSDKDFERPYALNPSAELEGGDIYYHNGKPIYLDWVGNPIPDPHVTHEAGLYDPWIETSDGVRHTGPTHIDILNDIQNRYEPEDVVRFGGGDAAPIWNIRFEQFMKERAREHQSSFHLAALPAQGWIYDPDDKRLYSGNAWHGQLVKENPHLMNKDNLVFGWFNHPSYPSEPVRVHSDNFPNYSGPDYKSEALAAAQEYYNQRNFHNDWEQPTTPINPYFAGAYPTDWTHKWIWADGKMDHCDAQLGQPNYSHHESMLHEMGYNAYTGQPENYIGGLYNANTGDYSSHGYWGRVPSEEELKAELAQRTSPKNHEASDRYTGPPASVVHIPTGDMGEPLGRIPGIYDSNTNIFYHGDRGGSHYPLVDHLRQPETDDDYLDDTVDYWDYMGDHMIPTIYFPVDSDYNGRLDWAQRIKPELQRQFMDAMERHVSNPTHEAYMLGRVRKHSWWEASWIYDATDGEVYHGYDHIEIIKEIPDYEKKAAEGQLVCGWYTTGDDPGVPSDHEGIGAPIRTDTVSGTLADKNSPHAQKAIQAAIADWHNSPEHFEVE